MRNIKSLLIVFVLVVACMMSCENSEAEAKEEASTPEVSDNKASEEVKTETTEAKGVLNVNLATEADLQGLGLPTEVIAIILKNRPFLDMMDLDKILIAGNKDELYKQMFVPLNLNTTAEADFKIIPGVGDRMAHEFEEYRPYTSVKQFRKEIGKYVDEDEVERYLNYVFIPVELNTASEEDIKALPGVGKKMTHEFEEYRPYKNMEQFRKEIGKYVDDNELKRLERLVYLKDN